MEVDHRPTTPNDIPRYSTPSAATPSAISKLASSVESSVKSTVKSLFPYEPQSPAPEEDPLFGLYQRDSHSSPQRASSPRASPPQAEPSSGPQDKTQSSESNIGGGGNARKRKAGTNAESRKKTKLFPKLPSNKEAFRTPKFTTEAKKLIWETPDESETVPARTERRHDQNRLKWFGEVVEYSRETAIRLMRGVLKDEVIREGVLPQESESQCCGEANMSCQEAYATVKSLQTFIKDPSNHGTRKTEHHKAVTAVLLAAIYDNPFAKSYKWLALKFPITAKFAKKIERLKQQGQVWEERKKRYDAMKVIANDFVYDFCHDSDFARPDTSVGGRGSTDRGFVYCKSKNGEKEKHFFRIWSCSTLAEKFEEFMKSDHYPKMRIKIIQEIPRLAPEILAAETILREHFQASEEKHFTRDELKRFIAEKGGRFKDHDLYVVLMREAFRLVIGYTVDDIASERLDEAAKKPTIGLQMFGELLCKCVRNPTVKSCVDTTYSQIEAYLKSLSKVISHDREIKALFDNCECDNCEDFRNPQRIPTKDNYQLRDFLNGSAQQILARSCCPRTAVPSFRNKLDAEDPTMIPFKCVEIGVNGRPACSECGMKNNFHDTFSCPVWRGCKIEIKTFEYKEAPRSGVDSNGKQRTQLELMESVLEFNEVVTRLFKFMEEKGRRHLVETMNSNRAIKNRGLVLDKKRLFLNIDFGATINCEPFEKMNCHECAHCVDLVVIAHVNGRWASLKINDDGSVTEHYIRDTIAIHAFAETISKGKKTDAWMIRRTIEENVNPNRTKWEDEGDPRLAKCSEGDITLRVCYYFSESEEEVERIRKSGLQHCHYIERNEPQQTTNTVKNTNNFREVYFPIQDLSSDERVMYSSTRSCACDNCLLGFDHKDCQHKQNQIVQKHVMTPKRTKKRPPPKTSSECDEALEKIETHPDFIRIIGDGLKNGPTVTQLKKVASEPKLGNIGDDEEETEDQGHDPESILPDEGVTASVAIVSCLTSALRGEKAISLDEEDESDEEDDLDNYNVSVPLGVGLKNFGNTCYLNALIQFLSASQYLFGDLVDLLSDEEMDHPPLLRELANTMLHLNGLDGNLSKSLCQLKRLFDYLGETDEERQSFQVGQNIFRQHDPTEFFNELIKRLRRATLPGSRTQQILGNFAVPALQVTNSEHKVEFTNVLYALHAEDGIVAGIDAWNKKSKTQIEHKPEFGIEFPKTVVVVMKKSLENGLLVETPPTKVERAIATPRGEYKLRATLNWIGSTGNSGHYFSYVKRAVVSDYIHEEHEADNDEEENETLWLRCDDDNCLTVKEEEVAEQGATIYALLYELPNKLQAQKISQLSCDMVANGMSSIRETVVFSNEYLLQENLETLSMESLRLQLEARGARSQAQSKVHLISSLNSALQRCQNDTC